MRFLTRSNGFGGKIAKFEGTFLVNPDAEGSVVEHTETFEFTRPLRTLMDPFLRKWLQREMVLETARLKVWFEDTESCLTTER